MPQQKNAPKAPKNLTAAVLTSPDRVVLSWGEGAGSPETYYTVERCTGTNCTGFIELQTLARNTVSTVDSSVVAGTAYRYRVKAWNQAGGSPYSNVVQASIAATTPTPPVTLNPPANLTATAGNASVTLLWSAVSGATSYTLQRGTSSGSETTIQSGLTVMTAIDQNLTNGQRYYYRVVAVAGLVTSAPSNEVSALPVAPTSPSGTIKTISAGQDLQLAFDQANPGDTLLLEAGASFTGNYRLRAKSTSGVITVTTTASAGNLPASGVRTSPSYAAFLPKIVTPNTDAALTTLGPAAGWTFQNVEIKTDYAATVNTVYNLVNLGTVDGDTNATSASFLPTDLIFDRCYFHGTPTGNCRRGIALNGARITVKKCYFQDIHEVGADSQALCSWNGSGPFTIDDNYLEAAGENVLFGGADPSIANLVPSDISITKNTFFKPLSWKPSDPSYAGIHWTVKNLLELKNAQRVTIDGNDFQNSWLDAQVGYGVLFTPRNQSGSAPWSVVQDVLFQNNIVAHVGGGVQILGTDDGDGNPAITSQPLRNVTIANNLWYDINTRLGENGWFAVLNLGSQNLTIAHNTVVDHSGGALLVFDGLTLRGTPTPNLNLVIRDNFAKHGSYGFFASGGNIGTAALAQFTSGGYTFLDNALGGMIEAGVSLSSYPATTLAPTNAQFTASFVDPGAGNYRLVANSPFKNAASDGTDIGINQDALEAAQA